MSKITYTCTYRFQALPSIICRGISRGQVKKVLRHKNVVLYYYNIKLSENKCQTLKLSSYFLRY